MLIFIEKISMSLNISLKNINSVITNYLVENGIPDQTTQQWKECVSEIEDKNDFVKIINDFVKVFGPVIETLCHGVDTLDNNAKKDRDRVIKSLWVGDVGTLESIEKMLKPLKKKTVVSKKKVPVKQDPKKWFVKKVSPELKKSVRNRNGELASKKKIKSTMKKVLKVMVKKVKTSNKMAKPAKNKKITKTVNSQVQTTKTNALETIRKARPDLNEQEVNEMFARLNAQINN